MMDMPNFFFQASRQAGKISLVFARQESISETDYYPRARQWFTYPCILIFLKGRNNESDWKSIGNHAKFRSATYAKISLVFAAAALALLAVVELCFEFFGQLAVAVHGMYWAPPSW